MASQRTMTFLKVTVVVLGSSIVGVGLGRLAGTMSPSRTIRGNCQTKKRHSHLSRVQIRSIHPRAMMSIPLSSKLTSETKKIKSGKRAIGLKSR